MLKLLQIFLRQYRCHICRGHREKWLQKKSHCGWSSLTVTRITRGIPREPHRCRKWHPFKLISYFDKFQELPMGAELAVFVNPPIFFERLRKSLRTFLISGKIECRQGIEHLSASSSTLHTAGRCHSQNVSSKILIPFFEEVLCVFISRILVC